MEKQENNSKEENLEEIVLNMREQCQIVENILKIQIELKDELIYKLHNELSYYKQDSADRFVEQLMKSVIKVRKDIKKVMESTEWDTMDAKDLKREYRYIFEDITDLLEQQNIDSYTTLPGILFDPGLHQAKTEPTDNEELNKTVKESIAEGYKRGSKILQPEKVIVYQYREND